MVCKRRVRRSEVFYADIPDGIGSEQKGTRPVVIVQNDVGNMYSPTVVVAEITAQVNKANLPTHVEFRRNGKTCTVMLEQLRTIDKLRLRERIGELSEEVMQEIDAKLLVSIGVDINTLAPRWVRWLSKSCKDIFKKRNRLGGN